VPEAPVAEAAPVTEPSAAAEEKPSEAEAALEQSAEATTETPAPDAPRRSRGRRGSRRGAATTPTAATERAPRVQETREAARPSAPEAQARGPEQPGRRQERRPEPARGARGNDTGRGTTVESLIARQNVLFEEFSNQQNQALREVQRSINGMRGGGIGGYSPILPKVGVFLDVPNLIYAAEQMGVRVHFGKLLEFLTNGRQLVRATAYAPITDDPATRFESQRFVAPVINQGYKVVTKPWKRFADGAMKANFDIELAVDILTMSDRLDIVVLLSGDSDFKRVLELVESKGVRVEVVAFSASTAAELRAVADAYIDLGSILSQVSA
jgi:uncharacterized LabA/DUF88 family protein